MMTTDVMPAYLTEESPRVKTTARAAGFFWLMTIITSVFALSTAGKIIVSGDAAATAANILAQESLFRAVFAADVLSAICYVTVTLLVYELLKPVSGRIALLATFFSLVGCAVGALGSLFFLVPLVVLRAPAYLSAFSTEQLQALALMLAGFRGQVNSIALVFFGLHCLLIGWLILRSTFLPRVLGVLMTVAGLGWLTYIYPPLSKALGPLSMLPGALGEGSLTLWLLIAGVNVERWHRQARQDRG